MVRFTRPFVSVVAADGAAVESLQVVTSRAVPQGSLANWASGALQRFEVRVPTDISGTPLPVDLVADVASALGQLPFDGHPHLAISVEDAELAKLPWERLTLQTGKQVVRYGYEEDPRAYTPVGIPPRLFIVEAPADPTRRESGGWSDGESVPRDVAERYFRVVRTARLGSEPLHRLIAAGPHDVVHIEVGVTLADTDPSDWVVRYSDGTPVEPGGLSKALLAASARLTVLAAIVEDEHAREAMDAVRALAYRIHSKTGVATIASPIAQFSDFYLNITHDYYITQLVANLVVLPTEYPPALWLRAGGDGALRLRRAAQRLHADVVSIASHAGLRGNGGGPTEGVLLLPPAPVVV